jgi:tRNA (mo5U34)-methyltransferase
METDIEGEARRQALLAAFRPNGRERASRADVVACIRAMFLREPTEEDLAPHLALLEKGLKRKQLFRNLFHGPEFARFSDEAHRARAIAAYKEVHGKYVSLPGGIRWFHSIRMPDGDVTDGIRAHAVLMREADAVFSASPEGKSVLDIGAWDGFFSFEAERRGAREVLSVDHPCWSGPRWGTKDGYDLAHRLLGSRARSKDVDLFALDPEVEGVHDMVLLLGVIYHLRDPYGGLARAAAMCREVLVLETVTDCNTLSAPVLRHYSGDELNADPNNFFAPNTACLRSMLGELGFSRVEIRRNPGPPDAARDPDAVRERDRHIVHAWR